MSLARLAGTFVGNAASASIAVRGRFNVSLSGTFGGGTVRLQRSYDGGGTWRTVSRDKDGNPAGYTAAADLVWDEPEPGVEYRLDLSGATAPSIAYRVSK